MNGGNAVVKIFLKNVQIDVALDQGFFGESVLESDIHSHAGYELILQTAGSFFVGLADGNSLPMGDGSICLIPPGHYHRIVGGSADAQKLAVRFHCVQEAKKSGLNTFYDHITGVLESYRQAAVMVDRQVQQKAVSLQQEFASVSFGGDVYRQALLMQLFILMIRCFGRNSCGDFADRVNKTEETRWLTIEEYMQENYSRQITQDDLARHMHLSKRQLSRVLRSVFSTSFRQLLIQVRMNQAAQLLKQTDRSVEQIASAVGYTSVSGFYDAFEKMYGISAGEYRKQS